MTAIRIGGEQHKVPDFVLEVTGLRRRDPTVFRL